MHAVADIVPPAQLFEDPDQRQLLASGLDCIRRQQSVELRCPSSQLWSRLEHTAIFSHRPSLCGRTVALDGDGGVFTCRKVVLDVMREQKKGNIVVASVAAFIGHSNSDDTTSTNARLGLTRNLSSRRRWGHSPETELRVVGIDAVDGNDDSFRNTT